MTCPDPAQWRTNCRTRSEWFETALPHGLCLLNVHNIIYSSLMIVTQTPDSHEECDRPSTSELRTHLESLNDLKIFICSSLSLGGRSTSPLSLYSLEPPPQLKSNSPPLGQTMKERLWTPLTTRWTWGMELTHWWQALEDQDTNRDTICQPGLYSLLGCSSPPALYYASLAKIYLLLLLHLRLHLLAACSVSWFNFLLCQAKHQMLLACLWQGIKSPLSFWTFQLLSPGTPSLSLWSRWKPIIVIINIVIINCMF